MTIPWYTLIGYLLSFCFILVGIRYYLLDFMTDLGQFVGRFVTRYWASLLIGAAFSLAMGIALLG